MSRLLSVFVPLLAVPPAAPQLLVGTPTRASVLVHWKSVGPDVTGYSLHYRRQHGDPSRVDLPRRAQLYDLKVWLGWGSSLFPSSALIFLFYYFFLFFI